MLFSELNDSRLFCRFFFELLSKFSDIINSDDCIGKITSKSVRLQPFLIQEKIYSQ